MSIPVYLGLHSQGSYLLFYENSFPGEISFQEQASAHFEGGALRYYFIPGPPDKALADYMALTGFPPLPPRWALGYHQSRWGYTTEAQLREVVEGFRRHDLPLDAVHLDIDYMDGFRLFTVDKTRFPDLPGLAKELKDQGIRLVTILDCGIKQDPENPVYREGLEKNLFLKSPNGKPVKALVWPGWSAFPDFTDAEVRDWWGGQYAALLEAGASGVWHDMNEPGTFSAWGDPTLPTVSRHAMGGRGGSHREAHNLYGLLMGKAGYEGLQKLQPEKRAWLLTRSGWAGIQRYAWHWTADTESSWEMLKQTIPSLLGLSLSGIPFSGSDIGGFSGSPSPDLFLRWFQMAAFVPFFRNHAAVGTPPREPWRFDPKITNILRDFLQLRGRLIPYLYTLAWEAAKTGQPLMRPLFWHNPDDKDLWDEADAYLLGRDLLIAPIVEPGAQIRRQRLPAGSWYSFWDGTRYEGPGEVEVPVSIETIPVLVRAGSALPLMAPGHRRQEPSIELHLYPSLEQETSSLLFSDAGEGHGPHRIDRFDLEFHGQELTLQWHQEISDYIFPYHNINVHWHGVKVGKVWIDGEPVSPEAGSLQVGFFQMIRMEIARE
jgi:alpha-glucosidase